jgi:hypothetical protein
MGARYTLTDLDGSNPKKESLKSSQFGNINNNDWYVFRVDINVYLWRKTMLLCRLRQ